MAISSSKYLIFIPPVTCFPVGYRPHIGALLRGETCFLLGALYGHHDLSYSSLPNDRTGMELTEPIVVETARLLDFPSDDDL